MAEPPWRDLEASLHAVVATRRAALLVVLAGLAGLLVVGPGSAPRPSLVAPDAVVTTAGAPGFGQIAVLVTPGPGLPAPTRVGCALLAATAAQRDRGLMGRRALGRYAGMLFRFPTPTTDVFYMYKTPLPLSLAWFDAGGRLVGQTDMPSCTTAASGCPSYGAPQPFTMALEVPRGSLGGLGLGPGSTITAGGPCTG